jgi:hypothetical protein
MVAMMDRRPFPSELTPDEQRKRAAMYREMAVTATTADIRDALLGLAQRFEEMANEKAEVPFTA